MKYLLGIYSVFITLFYIAFFTLSGDFVIGLYSKPYLALAIIFILAAFIFDVRKGKKDARAKTYLLNLFYLNLPLVIVSFFVPLINGNRTINEILIYSIPMTIAMFIGLFVTVPILGFVFGLVVDALRMDRKRLIKQEKGKTNLTETSPQS